MDYPGGNYEHPVSITPRTVIILVSALKLATFGDLYLLLSWFIVKSRKMIWIKNSNAQNFEIAQQLNLQ